jgi:subtilisin family serine protease
MQVTSTVPQLSFRSLAAVATTLLLLSPGMLAQQPSKPGVRFDPHKPRLVVRLNPGAKPYALAAALGGSVVRSDAARGFDLIDMPGASKGLVESVAWAVKGLPTVIFAESDEEADAPESPECGFPEYDYGAQQCTIAFIDGTPSPGEYDEQSAMLQMRCAEAHALATGTPLVVAVIDTGIQLNHPLFADRIAPGGWDYILDIAGGADVPNGIDDDGDTSIDEGAGHGSHVAGLVALADPNALILPMRVLDSEGNGTAFLISMAIHDAVDLGATVINLSLSTRTPCAVIAEALAYAEYEGVTVVTSAGNAGVGTMFPGSYDPADFAPPSWLPSGTTLTGANLVTVSSVNEDDIKPTFACYGPDVDLCTPGFDIYSAQLGNAYAWWSGTSMSAGLASGALSFLESIWSQGSYSGTAAELLQATAFDLDAWNPAYAGGLGDGRIDLLAATNLLLGL